MPPRVTAPTLATAQAALDAADDAHGPADAQWHRAHGANVVITNAAPDEGLSAPFNSWFTLFGQFFDHGLDLVAKGGNGTVFIPLMPDDPLFVDPTRRPESANFMVLTRATLAPGQTDGIMGTADDTDRPVNTTTSFVDQNQTYTSHPSHQVFLRAYELDAPATPSRPASSSKARNGGMATWATSRPRRADLLGIQLIDCQCRQSFRCWPPTSMATSSADAKGYPADRDGRMPRLVRRQPAGEWFRAPASCVNPRRR